MAKLLIIDNYDSFTYNLMHYLEDNIYGVSIDVHLPSELIQVDKRDYNGFLISPGPSHPKDRADVMDFIESVYYTHPILGVCLGHQMLWHMSGGTVVRGTRPIHGHQSKVTHDGKFLFEGLNNPFTVTRYHSLICKGESNDFEVCARSEDGVNMAIRHKSLPIFGVQYHPEAILSNNGKAQLNHFLKIVVERSKNDSSREI